MHLERNTVDSDQPELGDEWASRTGGASVTIVGVVPSHILVRDAHSVFRVRRDRMTARYRLVRRGASRERVATVNTGANPYGVAKGQSWRSNNPRLPRVIDVLEVIVDDGHAIIRAQDGTKAVRLRLERFCPGRTGYTLVSEGGA